eukprot:1152834-Pelagomonas_calceolata.AAC.1
MLDENVSPAADQPDPWAVGQSPCNPRNPSPCTRNARRWLWRSQEARTNCRPRDLISSMQDYAGNSPSHE